MRAGSDPLLTGRSRGRTSSGSSTPARAAAGSGLRVELGGDAARGAEERGEAGEGAGLLAALVILVMLFGSLVAASLPIVTAVFAVGSALGVIDARGTELDARSEVAPQRTC